MVSNLQKQVDTLVIINTVNEPTFFPNTKTTHRTH